MPITNLNNDHFNDKEKEKITTLWKAIMQMLAPFTRNLTPDERLKYGSISEENKLVVQKSLDYSVFQPHLNCPDVNYKELADDWADRQFLAGFLSQMVEASNIVNNIRILHDYDAFQASMVDYRYTKYKMGTEPGAGFEAKYNDFLYFFKNGSPEVVTGEKPDAPVD